MNDFTIVDTPQRSPEWFEARRGRVTGSKAGIIYMGDKTAGREDYRVQLALEIGTGNVEPESFLSKEMKHGIEMEAPAKLALEERDGVLIRETGFLRHNKLMIGISLDGSDYDFGRTYEFKCPKSKNHMRYLENKTLPQMYRAQIMHGLYVTGASEAVFCSYDDRVLKGLELFTVVVKASDLPMEEYEKKLLQFLKEVKQTVAKHKLMQRGAL